MTIRDSALAAFDADRQARVDEALDRLASTVLHDPAKSGPAVDPKTLTVAHEDHGADMFVFTDGDVHLAVRGDEVTLVENRDGWTKMAGPLETLAGLGAELAGN